MATQKLYAGAKLRELRSQAALTQKELARQLGISLPYLNQMENNKRPVSDLVAACLARDFGLEHGALAGADIETLMADMMRALDDPMFGEVAPSDLRVAATQAETLARAFLDLHQRYRTAEDQLDMMGGFDQQPEPVAEVLQFLQDNGHYFDTLDRAAEAFSTQKGGLRNARVAAVSKLGNRGIRVEFVLQNTQAGYDADEQVLRISRSAPHASQSFQLLSELALLTQDELLDDVLATTAFQNPDADQIARHALANYFAAAVLMPYTRFLEAAQAERHDLERLAMRFGASIEQVARRLCSLRRPEAEGIPFFFLRTDPAGTVTRFATAMDAPFARTGRACPLWSTRCALKTPGEFQRQLIQSPGGARMVSAAHEVTKPGGQFGAPPSRHSFALGCDVKHAAEWTYADGLDLAGTFEQLGRVHQPKNPVAFDHPVHADPEPAQKLELEAG